MMKFIESMINPIPNITLYVTDGRVEKHRVHASLSRLFQKYVNFHASTGLSGSFNSHDFV